MSDKYFGGDITYIKLSEISFSLNKLGEINLYQQHNVPPLLICELPLTLKNERYHALPNQIEGQFLS